MLSQGELLTLVIAVISAETAMLLADYVDDLDCSTMSFSTRPLLYRNLIT